MSTITEDGKVSADVQEAINELIQIDIDAFFVYGEALKTIKEVDIHDQLINFQRDHEEHIKKLSELLRKMGGQPIRYSQDLKGYVIQGVTWLRSIMGTEGALKGLASTEKLTNEKYQKALKLKSFTKEVIDQISKNFQDKKIHLEYIKKKLSDLEEEED